MRDRTGAFSSPLVTRAVNETLRESLLFLLFKLNNVRTIRIWGNQLW